MLSIISCWYPCGIQSWGFFEGSLPVQRIEHFFVFFSNCKEREKSLEKKKEGKNEKETSSGIFPSLQKLRIFVPSAQWKLYKKVFIFLKRNFNIEAFEKKIEGSLSLNKLSPDQNPLTLGKWIRIFFPEFFCLIGI